MMDIIAAVFNGVWGLMGITYPGTGMSFRTIALGALGVYMGLMLINVFLGLARASMPTTSGLVREHRTAQFRQAMLESRKNNNKK